MSKRLLFVVNVDWFFLSHRLPIALAAKIAGYEVHVAVGITDRLEELKSHGLIVHEFRLQRGNGRWIGEMMSLMRLIQIFRDVKPDLVHLVTIKPVLYGGFAAKLTRVPALVVAISGLGHVFVASGVRARVRQWIVGILYRLAMSHERMVVIFQNPTDRDNLSRLARLDVSRTVMVKGSGVDLQRYHMVPIPEGVPCVVMACRLINDKGVCQFIEAARILKERGIVTRFCLVGSIDTDNPSSLSNSDLRNLGLEGVVELWGHRSDMAAVMQQATIVTLPSFYGEGLPKVLIEAAACGRPCVTTNVPGCRDAIDDEVTGLLVPPRDSIALANALDRLLHDLQLCRKMGEAGRRKAEAEFDLAFVVSKHLQIYKDLLPLLLERESKAS